MGRGYTQFGFPDSNAEDTFALYSAFLYYRMPDGSLLHVRQKVCWCPVCEQLDMAEQIPSLVELEAELAKLLDPDEEQLRLIAFTQEPLEELISEARARIEWRRHRKSPARCLRCGSTDLTHIPDQNEFPHPKTGERVVVVGRG